MKLRVKSCHAFALALVGWYLMMPPLSNDAKPRSDAPLYEWTHGDAPPFLTVAECEAQKAAAMNGSAYKGLPAVLIEEFRKAAPYDLCVKSDDPRLYADPKMPADLRQLLLENAQKGN